MDDRPIFVFGSNRQGRHGKGMALTARKSFGAIYGQAEGLQGHSYAIITKELRSNFPPVSLEEVRDGVNKFIKFAAEHPDLKFYVSNVGCGLAGFSLLQIAPLFKDVPNNVRLSDLFQRILDE